MTRFQEAALQIVFSVIEAKIRTKLKERGIDPEVLIREILEAANKSRTNQNRFPSKSPTQTTAQALSVLNLHSTASPQEIKTKFRQLALKLHPDQSKDPATGEKLKKVIDAYNVLKNAGRVE